MIAIMHDCLPDHEDDGAAGWQAPGRFLRYLLPRLGWLLRWTHAYPATMSAGRAVDESNVGQPRHELPSEPADLVEVVPEAEVMQVVERVERRYEELLRRLAE